MVDTLYKLFNIPVKGLNLGGPDTSKGVGIPQGNPLSSLLVNVYLNELDHFMDQLKKSVDKEVPNQLIRNGLRLLGLELPSYLELKLEKRK